MTEKATRQAAMNASDAANSITQMKQYPRLPCRGCLASCKNYALCDGKLWRMAK